jgi:hypothetical protein
MRVRSAIENADSIREHWDGDPDNEWLEVGNRGIAAARENASDTHAMASRTARAIYRLAPLAHDRSLLITAQHAAADARDGFGHLTITLEGHTVLGATPDQLRAAGVAVRNARFAVEQVRDELGELRNPSQQSR